MKLNKLTFFAIALIFTLSACKKDKTEVIEPEEPKEQIINEWITIDKKGVVNVKDLKIQSTRRIYVYFSLEGMKFVEADKALTSDWDICFSDANGVRIQSNLGTTTNPDAPYFGGTGRVSMAFTGKSFDDVTAPPAAADFDETGEFGLYLQNNIEPENERHWGKYIYKENGLASHVVPLPNKTVVLKLSDGRYAKLEYQSFYKGGLLNPTLADYLPENLGYANFRYYISKKGSTDLNTK